jgi:hypothetical protein
MDRTKVKLFVGFANDKSDAAPLLFKMHETCTKNPLAFDFVLRAQMWMGCECYVPFDRIFQNHFDLGHQS